MAYMSQEHKARIAAQPGKIMNESHAKYNAVGTTIINQKGWNEAIDTAEQQREIDAIHCMDRERMLRPISDALAQCWPMDAPEIMPAGYCYNRAGLAFLGHCARWQQS